MYAYAYNECMCAMSGLQDKHMYIEVCIMMCRIQQFFECMYNMMRMQMLMCTYLGME